MFRHINFETDGYKFDTDSILLIAVEFTSETGAWNTSFFTVNKIYSQTTIFLKKLTSSERL